MRKIFILFITCAFVLITSNYAQTVTDVDGNTYGTVTIGEQKWMSENLRTSHYRNGDDIINMSDSISWANTTSRSGAWCWYNNDSLNDLKYGKLYNWFIVDDSRGVCPFGWHVPTEQEWQQLETYLGMEKPSIDSTGYRGSLEAGMLKDTGTILWRVPNTGATNETGFSALPGGYRNSNGGFFSAGVESRLWTSTEETANMAWSRVISNKETRISRQSYGKTRGYSVRCIENNKNMCKGKAAFTYISDTASDALVFTNTMLGEYYLQWSFGDGTYSYVPSLVKIYTTPGLYTVKLSVASKVDSTCFDYHFEQIQVGDIPCYADFSVEIDTANGKATFANKSSENISDYYWMFGDGTVSYQKNPLHTYKNNGYYTVYLRAFDKQTECVDTAQKVILIGGIDDDCEADFNYVVNDTAVVFIDNSLGNIVSYYWDFGDKKTDMTQKSPTHSYVNKGLYNVCLTVKNKRGIKNMNCKTVEVSPQDKDNCQARFEWVADSASNAISFVNTSLGTPDSWKWMFGDGDSSLLQKVSHAYNKSGLYPVGLTVRDSKTGCKSSYYSLVEAGKTSNALKVQFVLTGLYSNLKKGGYPVDFVGITVGKPAQYEWDYGDGTKATGTTTPGHTYDSAGTYEVCVTASDQVTGMSDTFCQNVEVEYEVSVPEFSLNTVGLKVYPNPFSVQFNMSYTLNKPAHVEAIIYDIQGRKLATLFNINNTEGIQHYTWNADALYPGIYMLEFRIDNRREAIYMIEKK